MGVAGFGAFCSTGGADAFSPLRGYASTLHMHGAARYVPRSQPSSPPTLSYLCLNGHCLSSAYNASLASVIARAFRSVQT